jgi:hypothetical protein
MTSPDSTNPRRELEAAALLIGDARRTLAKGGLVELAALESRIGDVCRAILELPREQGLAFAQPMQQLIDGLERLGSDIQVRLESIRDQANASQDQSPD